MQIFVTLALLAAYVINLFFSMQFGQSPIGDVGEALLLFATSLSFVWLVLHREAKAENQNS